MKHRCESIQGACSESNLWAWCVFNHLSLLWILQGAWCETNQGAWWEFNQGPWYESNQEACYESNLSAWCESNQLSLLWIQPKSLMWIQPIESAVNPTKKPDVNPTKEPVVNPTSEPDLNPTIWVCCESNQGAWCELPPTWKIWGTSVYLKVCPRKTWVGLEGC